MRVPDKDPRLIDILRLHRLREGLHTLVVLVRIPVAGPATSAIFRLHLGVQSWQGLVR